MSSDWHFGNAGNSEKHNQDLLDFIQWMITWSIDNNVDHFAHLGDLYHSRDKLDVNTIEYATRGVKMLHERFGKFTQLKGNHDLYLRDSRDICSLHMFDDYTHLINDYHIEGNVMYVSWICNQEEYDHIINLTKKHKIKYVMGHFEFSNFHLNDHYLMEHGSSHRELKHIKKIFTGHYHGRQEMDNVVYIGNPFPFDFNDANDMNKGFCVLDTETGKYEFINYEKIAVIDVTPEQLLEMDWEELEQENISIRIVATDNLSHEDLDKIKELLENTQFRTSKLVYKQSKSQSEDNDENIEIDRLMSVDETVLTYIKGISDSNIDKNLMVKLYEESMEESK